MTVDKGTVEKILTEALAAVDAAEIPDDLRSLAFGKAVELLAGGAPLPKGGGWKEDVASGDGTSSDGADERITEIAKRLGVGADKLAYVYDLEADDVNVIIPRSKLGLGKATGTKELALLYCAARQAGGYDETHTPVESIRLRVEDMGVYDGKNFATHMKSIVDLTVRGSGQSREFKVTNPGYEEAAKIVTRLTGGGA